MAVEKLKYANAAAITIGLAALASSASRLAGRASTAIDNGTTLYLNALVSGFITTGAGPTAGTRIDVYVYAAHDETPTYQAPFDGTDSAETLTVAGMRTAQLAKLGQSIVVDDAARTYYVKPTSVAALFGGILPRFWGLFVAHDTGVALDADAGDHGFKFTGVHRETV